MLRRRGAVILDTEKGILVVAGRSKKFSLPGGGAKKYESRKKAAIRELYEETGLKAIKVSYLFDHIGQKWHNHKEKLVRNNTKIFLVKSEGVPKPKSEIKHIGFWKPGSKLRISKGAKRAIERYIKEKAK